MVKKEKRRTPSGSFLVFLKSKAVFPPCQPPLTLRSALGGVLFMDNTLVTQTRAAMAAAEAAEVVAGFLVDETEELAEPVRM